MYPVLTLSVGGEMKPLESREGVDLTGVGE